jgi:hypothetical protein
MAKKINLRLVELNRFSALLVQIGQEKQGGFSLAKLADAISVAKKFSFDTIKIEFDKKEKLDELGVHFAIGGKEALEAKMRQIVFKNEKGELASQLSWEEFDKDGKEIVARTVELSDDEINFIDEIISELDKDKKIKFPQDSYLISLNQKINEIKGITVEDVLGKK